MADFKIVYAVVERLGKRHWLRIGMAFVNRDGSLNVKLDALPLNGQLQIRDPASVVGSGSQLGEIDPELSRGASSIVGNAPPAKAPKKKSPTRGGASGV